MSRRHPRLAPGFTLIEMMVVLALVGMLAGTVVAFLWDLWGRRDVLMRDSTDSQAGSAVVERIEADIQSGLAGDQGVGPGIKGTATTLRLLTRGVDLPVNAHTSGDLQASEYRFDGGVLKARRWNVGAAVPEMETVCDHVEAVRLRYFDGKEWQAGFDSLSAGMLPVAIEFALWFGVPKADEDAPRAATPAGGQDSGKPAPDAEPGAANLARGGQDSAGAAPARQPDRLRVIVVPDGPVTSWRESR